MQSLHGGALSLEAVFEALQEADATPPATVLAQLSEAGADDRARFARLFPDLSIQRRREVIDALADLADDSVELTFDHVFLVGLDDPDVQVRAQSVKALWENETPELARRLIALLADAESLVRGEAADALGRFLTRAELTDEAQPHTEAIEAALRDLYDDERQLPELRGRALEALGVRSAEWVQDLIEDAYNGGHPRLAISAVHAMGRSADPHWLPVICEQMASEDAEMRFEAAQAAGEMGAEEAVADLAGLTEDDDAEVQEAAIRALGAIGGAAAMDILRDLVAESEDARVQEAAGDALAQAEFLEDPMAFKLYLGDADADDGDDGIDMDEDA